MDFNYSFQQEDFNSSFTCREDDGRKVYSVDLKEDGHKKLLGNQMKVIFSKSRNRYEPPDFPEEKARELAGFIAVAIEQFEKNKA
jgi:hypothetical protein